jgi:hypothetical protein
MAVIKTVQEESLVALGDAIREKAGTNEPLVFPTGMIEAIAGIETGGGSIEVEPTVLTGDCQYACSGGLSGKYIELFGDKISTQNITSTNSMFSTCSFNNPISFPFDINMSTSSSSHPMSRMFSSASLVALPKINNAKPSALQYMFENSKIRAVPDDFANNWDWSYINNSSGSYLSHIFNGCHYLRYISPQFLQHLYTSGTTSSGVVMYLGFYNCYLLDEIKRLGVATGTLTSNRCNDMLTTCSRLKCFTFDTNDDGTPKTAKWKSQTLAFNSNVGYSSSSTMIPSKGIGEDKQVIDDATYQALKDDPDYWTTKLEYSRYNHDSAVETINSLPDTSAYLAEKGGTNTIKFKGASGSATDGGAINTLTEEEIAVAAAKGWTVSFA